MRTKRWPQNDLNPDFQWGNEWLPDHGYSSSLACRRNRRSLQITPRCSRISTIDEPCDPAMAVDVQELGSWSWCGTSDLSWVCILVCIFCKFFPLDPIRFVRDGIGVVGMLGLRAFQRQQYRRERKVESYSWFGPVVIHLYHRTPDKSNDVWAEKKTTRK